MSRQTKRTLSAETRRKMSLVHMGKKLSDSHRESIRKAKLGTKHSQETKDKIGAANRGKIISEKQKRVISRARKGAKMSPEALKKMSEVHRKRCKSDLMEKRILNSYNRKKDRGERIKITDIAREAKCSNEKVCIFLKSQGLKPSGVEGFPSPLRKKIRSEDTKTGEIRDFESLTEARDTLSELHEIKFSQGAISRAIKRGIHHHDHAFWLQ